MRESQWTGQSTQAQNKDYDLDHPNVHFIYELLEHEKGKDLKIQSCRISMTPDNNRISKGSPSEGPDWIGYQKPEDLNQTNDSLH